MLGVHAFVHCTHNGVNLAHLRRGIRADVLDKLGLDVPKILTLKNAAGGSTWSCGVTSSSASAHKQSVTSHPLGLMMHTISHTRTPHTHNPHCSQERGSDAA